MQTFLSTHFIRYTLFVNLVKLAKKEKKQPTRKKNVKNCTCIEFFLLLIFPYHSFKLDFFLQNLNNGIEMKSGLISSVIASLKKLLDALFLSKPKVCINFVNVMLVSLQGCIYKVATNLISFPTLPFFNLITFFSLPFPFPFLFFPLSHLQHGPHPFGLSDLFTMLSCLWDCA